MEPNLSNTEISNSGSKPRKDITMSKYCLLVGLFVCQSVLAANWTKSESVSEMDGTRYTHYVLKSDNKVQLDFPYQGGTTGVIQLTKNNQNESTNPFTSMFYVDQGMIDCGFETCYFRAKFDDGPVYDLEGTRCSNGDFGCIRIYDSKFYNLAATAKKIKIEVTFYAQYQKVFNFNIK